MSNNLQEDVDVLLIFMMGLYYRFYLAILKTYYGQESTVSC